MPGSGLTRPFQDYHAHLATGNGKVYLYPKADGYLTSYNIHTGKKVREYTKTIKLSAGSGVFVSKKAKNSHKTPYAKPMQLAFSSVLVLGDKLVQTFGDKAWLMNESSGDVLGSFTANGTLAMALVSKDGHFYANELKISNPWGLFLSRCPTSSLGGGVPQKLHQGLSGPENGYLGYYDNVPENLGGQRSTNSGDVVAIKTSDGSQTYRKTEIGSQFVKMIDGKLQDVDWGSMNVHNPENGARMAIIAGIWAGARIRHPLRSIS